MNVIICLGGDYRRNISAALITKQNPDAVVLVSTETENQAVADIYKNTGVDLNKIWFDFHAWDTVSNFTETYKWIKNKKPKKLWVVTSDYHMRRSMAIANVVYALSGIELISIEHPSDSDRKEPLSQVIACALRALVWHITGNPGGEGAKKQRMPGFEIAKQQTIALGLQVVPD